MQKTIELYIGGKKIDLPDNFDVEWTYQSTDYTNPTIIKNSYTKTVNIDGTQNNNNIFNHIWNLQRQMDSNFTLFNPSQRVDFSLFCNGEIAECGYAKLDSITNENGKTSYSLSLYGGLASFFYALAYDLNTDNERTLASLNFTGGPDQDNEFDFTISKDAIYDAWSRLKNSGSGTSMWDYINFITANNGLPDGFDSDRVLINTNGIESNTVRYTTDNGLVNGSFPMSISDNDRQYRPINGYVTGEMMRECTDSEMLDLRSYLMRPALSVKGLFKAICDKQNNGGFNVILDSDFFSQDNPYYSKAWITLPMLNPETNGTDEMIAWDWYKNSEHIDDYGRGTFNWLLGSVEPIQGTPDTFSMDVELHTTINSDAEKIYTSTLNNNAYDPDWEEGPQQNIYLGCTTIQMYGFGDGQGVWYNRPARCGSNLLVLTSRLNGEHISNLTVNTWYAFRPYTNSELQYNFGYWKKVSGSDYVWHNEDADTDTITITMDSNLMSEIPNIAFEFSNIMSLDGMFVDGLCGYGFDSQYYDYYYTMAQGKRKYWNHMDITSLDSSITYKVNGKMRSFQPVKKSDLLGGLEGTPCDWLLSYCKLFGLFIEKDKIENTIYIKMRNNWYVDDIIDIEKEIDRSKSLDITPLTFESKWYNFNYGEAEGKYENTYKDLYAQDFGEQLIDTKYNFDADAIDLLEDNSFRNGITVLDKSNYYNIKKDSNGNIIPNCLYNWCTVTYYNDENTKETNMALPQNNTIYPMNPNTPKEFCDVMPKMHFADESKGAVDGDGVLVFYGGFKNTGEARYWISDDVDEMFISSENPCWLATESEYNKAGTDRVAICVNSLPSFERYVTKRGTITATLDFGYTKELYIPYYRYDINRTPTMYENFWKSYIQDLYSVNTRKVDCYVNINSNDLYDYLKHFYWFDNSIWVCTKIDNYAVGTERSTLCEFTKVNDKDAYLESPTFVDDTFEFYRTDGSGLVPAQGTDEERSVYFNVDSSTSWIVADVGVGYSYFDANYPTQGNGGMCNVIKATFMPNYNQSPRTCGYVAVNADGQQIAIEVTQEGYKKKKYLTVSPDGVGLPRYVSSPEIVDVDSSSEWSASVDQDWVTIGSSTGNSGTTSIQVSASLNDTKFDRTSYIDISNSDGLLTTLVVKQKCNFDIRIRQNEIHPTTTMPASGGNLFYRITSDSQFVLTADGNTEVFAPASGLVHFGDTVNPTNGTNFWLAFSPNNSTVSRNANFYGVYTEGQQDYLIWPTPRPVEQQASGNSIVSLSGNSQQVNTQLGANLQWTATTSNNWITLSSSSGTYSDSYVSYSVTQNNGSFRTGYIYITYIDSMGFNVNEVIEVRQRSTNSSVVVNPTGVTDSYKGGGHFVEVTTQDKFVIADKPDWVRITMVNDGVIAFDVEENGGYDRNGTITIETGGQEMAIDISQGSRYSEDYVLDFSPNDIIFDSTGGTIDVTIRSNSDWFIESGSPEYVAYEDCPVCSGRGLVTEECQDCGGSGLIPGGICWECGGTGQIKMGSRFFDCPNCDGSGYETMYTCNTCNGTGEVEVECGNCGGEGRIIIE